MPYLSCNDCGVSQSAETIVCPSCGSTNTMINIPLSHFIPLEEITITAIVRHRMWSFLPAAIDALLNAMTNPSALEIKGECLMAISSAAFLVEGVVTDYIEMELEAQRSVVEKTVEAEKDLNRLDGIGWDKKKKLAKRLGWDLPAIEGFDLVEVLFGMRGNLGHGRSYCIVDPRNLQDGVWRRVNPVRINSDKYYSVYQKLNELGLVTSLEEDPGLSTEVFLTPKVTRAFYEMALAYVRAFFEAVKLTSGENLRDEFEQAVKIGGK